MARVELRRFSNSTATAWLSLHHDNNTKTAEGPQVAQSRRDYPHGRLASLLPKPQLPPAHHTRRLSCAPPACLLPRDSAKNDSEMTLMKTLKLLWGIAWKLATMVLASLLLFTALTAETHEIRMIHLIGAFVVLIHYEVTR